MRQSFGLLVILCLACSASPTAGVDCGASASPNKLQQPLNGGSTTAGYLALAESELAAVVGLEATNESGETLSSCSGTLIAQSWVLSAAHCDPGSAHEFRVFAIDGSGERGPVITADRFVSHPDLDLLLLHVAQGAFPVVSPLAVRVQPGALRPGQRMQLAGTGEVEATGQPARSFAVTEISSVADTLLTVSAGGYAGACLGDSGGPLLTRGAEGQPEVVGVLSSGSASCWGEDSFVRTDSPAASAWLESTLGPEAHDFGCGLLDAKGRCFGAFAVWCDGGVLAGRDCTATGAACGFDVGQAGFRCVAAGADPCHGIGDLGECVEGNAVACVDGHLRTNACSQCGASCVVSPRSGSAVCSVSP